MAKKISCEVCTEPIPHARISAARLRGKTPTYCSDRCSNTAAMRRYRAALKQPPKKQRK